MNKDKIRQDKFNYEDAVAYILAIPKFTTKNNLEHTRGFLRELGDPHESYKVIHVAGSNGKGSVCSFLSSCLACNKTRVGMFTSPHLVEINERFQIQGEAIGNELFLEAFHRVLFCTRQMNKNGYPHPTFFEFLFLMAVLIFKWEQVEYAILETGLGGRLDATNAVLHPAAAVITSITMEHSEILGASIQAIAAEKAGIIKKGIPVIYDGSDKTAASVIEKRAQCLAADAYAVQDTMYEIFINEGKNIDFSFCYRYSKTINYKMKGKAAYQVANACLALMTLEVIAPEIQAEVLKAGIYGHKWPGRMEQVGSGLILDGAHNAGGMAAFAAALKLYPARRKIILFALVKEKDYQEIIRILCTNIKPDGLVITESGGARKVAAEKVKAEFLKYIKCPIMIEKETKTAFHQAKAMRGEGDLLCAVGSLYLVGDVKKLIKEEGYD